MKYENLEKFPIINKGQELSAEQIEELLNRFKEMYRIKTGLEDVDTKEFSEQIFSKSVIKRLSVQLQIEKETKSEVVQ